MAATAPRVVVASDAFKGSLTSAEVGAAVALGIRDVVPSAEVAVVPVADGGEGTVAAACWAGFDPVPATVAGPTGQPVEATLAVGPFGGRRTVVVEMADACGLGRLPDATPAPLTASSRGLGEALRAALDLEPALLVVGVGGSASTDGGAGMLAALGARVLDAAGEDLPDGGAALARVATVDTAGLDSRLGRVSIVLAADVDSPLTGPRGAARVFGPQKGATAEDVEVLDAALARWAEVVAPAAAAVPGAGAAGGVGFALMGVLGATRRPGVDVVLDLVGLDASLAGADLVVTGEGALDDQTLAGKAVTGVTRLARGRRVPVVAVCGTDLLGPARAAALGLAGVYALSDLEPDPVRSITGARELVRRTAARIARERLPGGTP
jgi:glycerate 2-kinase